MKSGEGHNVMASIARPVLSFLDRMYPGEMLEQHQERKIADSIKPTDVVSIASTPDSVFTVKPTSRSVSDTIRIAYGVQRADVDKIRKHLRDPSMPPRDIGLHTFEYFIEAEGLQ